LIGSEAPSSLCQFANNDKKWGTGHDNRERHHSGHGERPKNVSNQDTAISVARGHTSDGGPAKRGHANTENREPGDRASNGEWQMRIKRYECAA
jgi:hypothetical protein